MSVVLMPDGTLSVFHICPRCARHASVEGVDPDGYDKWRQGAFIQDALPDLASWEREVLMTGYHSSCFDMDFPPDDEDDDVL